MMEIGLGPMRRRSRCEKRRRRNPGGEPETEADGETASADDRDWIGDHPSTDAERETAGDPDEETETGDIVTESADYPDVIDGDVPEEVGGQVCEWKIEGDCCGIRG